MAQTIGQIIKKLRKERNLTQEELAEQLAVSSQAVSKWENETSLPDISQIVPLASVFGVSTDVLFGIFGVSDDEEAKALVERLSAVLDVTFDKDHLYAAYCELQEGLKRYPNNTRLLMQSLEWGISLAYPENECYDETHGKDIYQECIRQSNLVISYEKSINYILRARMIMIILHSTYGNSGQAWEHAQQFPWRADMTFHEISAYITHAEKNYTDEAVYCQRDLMYHFEAMLDDITQLGCAYRVLGKNDDASKIFLSVFSLINLIFAGETIMPPLQDRERGDVHVLIAETYLEKGDTEKALGWLEKMVDYDMKTRSQFRDDWYVTTPFLRDVEYPYYRPTKNVKKKLLVKLNSAGISSLKTNVRYQKLLERVHSMSD